MTKTGLLIIVKNKHKPIKSGYYILEFAGGSVMTSIMDIFLQNKTEF